MADDTVNNKHRSPNDIPKETESVEQRVNYTGEKQRREVQDLKEILLHSVKGIEKLQNDFELLGKQLAESESARDDLVYKDLSNQEEIYRLKELNSDLQTRIENELVQMKEENQRLKNDMKKEAEKHFRKMEYVYTKMVEKDKEIAKSKTIIQEQKYEISKIGGLESQITKKDKEIEKAKKEIEKQKTEISKIKRENVRNVTEINMQTERLLQDADQIQKNLEKKCKTLQNEIEGKTNQLQWLTSRFNQEKEGYLQQVQILTAEKKDLLLRLNKVASANMTYNNPNIADLSYEKRPTKLAEEFSDLYDNEWTDAFEEIEGENEEDKLTFILELLKRANQLCLDLSNEHTRKVKQSISTLTILMPRKQEQNNTNGSSDDDKLRQSQQKQNLPESIEQEKRNQRVKVKDGSEGQTEGECLEEKKGDMIESQKTRLESDFEKLRTEQKKTILEATKYFETLLSEDVKKAVTEVIVNEKGIDDEKQKCVVVYIENCIDLCWSMLRHKPPVHVDLPDIISNIPFDTNKYKPYTKTGKHLAYIVWPALYLHEGGPLLSKGVAQGK